MIKNPQKYKKYDSPNGWGTYETTLYSIEKLYKAIQEYAEIDGLENVFLDFTQESDNNEYNKSNKTDEF